jgi:hypothetical protein
LRTLVISDLHLGARGERDRLRDPGALDRLRAALRDVDRLVLLGDVVELREGPQRDALATASRVLQEVGGGLSPGSEVVLVPGNHDHHLLAGWLERRAAAGPPPPLGLGTEIEATGGEPLAVLLEALRHGGATVRAAYPGLWLRDDVYATHGHYLDRHTTVPMMERLGAGAMARITRRPLSEASTAEDYEAVLGPIYAWLFALAQSATPAGATGPGSSSRIWQSIGRGARRGRVRRRAVLTGVGAGILAINRAGLGPVNADLSVGELRRAGLHALGEVVRSLSITAEHVVFGHTHRAGPRAGDDPGEWRAPGGARLYNTGCWVHEPAFLGPRAAESPYRAGFAIRVGDAGPPELVNLLD